jgi:hypothetical protein
MLRVAAIGILSFACLLIVHTFRQLHGAPDNEAGVLLRRLAAARRSIAELKRARWQLTHSVAEQPSVFDADPASAGQANPFNGGEFRRQRFATATDAGRPLVLALHFPQFYASSDGFASRWDVVRNGEGYSSHISHNKHSGTATAAAAAAAAPLSQPSELGYYNLLQFQPRRSQRVLAEQYGVDGFVYQHCWRGGVGGGGSGRGRAAAGGGAAATMDGVLQAMLRDGEPDLPFALLWADTQACAARPAFSGAGAGVGVVGVGAGAGAGEGAKAGAEAGEAEADGGGLDGPVQWGAHWEWLLPFLRHPNCIRINGAPLLLVHRGGRGGEGGGGGGGGSDGGGGDGGGGGGGGGRGGGGGNRGARARARKLQFLRHRAAEEAGVGGLHIVRVVDRDVPAEDSNADLGGGEGEGEGEDALLQFVAPEARVPPAGVPGQQRQRQRQRQQQQQQQQQQRQRQRQRQRERQQQQQSPSTYPFSVSRPSSAFSSYRSLAHIRHDCSDVATASLTSFGRPRAAR